MLNFTEIFIRRPVLATVVSLFILFAGITSYFSLSLRQFPKIVNNVINIDVDASGYAPEIIESNIVSPIESAVSTVDGIDYVGSESGDGYGEINVILKLGRDLNTVMADVANKAESVYSNFPSDIKQPTISKVDPYARSILVTGFFSDRMTQEELTDYLIRVVQPQLKTVNGVGEADLDGGKEYAMRIWLNPYAMAARNITASDVSQAITSEQLQVATGEMQNLWQKFPINALTNLSTAEQFDNIVVKNTDSQFIKLMDIGHAEIGAKNSENLMTIDERPAVAIPIYLKGDANPLEVTNGAKKALERMKQYFPSGLKTVTGYDASVFIRASIEEIGKSFLIAAFFVIAIVFIFLGSVRVLLIPIITIPLSIIGVFSIMLSLGYSLNILTLLALVLAIGMVVDDAIVVVENIYRHMTLGKTSLEAAIAGAKEIQFAIISITLTLIAVYAPIGFTSGVTTILFKEFAFTLAGTIVISGIIALTLSPMMCSKIMTPQVLEGKFALASHRAVAKMVSIYKAILLKILHKRFFVLFFLTMVLVSCYFLYSFLSHDLAPREDTGFISTEIESPRGSNVEFTKKYADRLSAIYKTIPEIVHYGIHVYGGNWGDSLALLKPWSERTRSSFSIIAELRAKYKKIPWLKLSPICPQFLPGNNSAPISLAIQTTGNFEELNAVTQKLLVAIKKNPYLADISTLFKIDQPQLNITINRDKAGILGISVQDITDAINLAFGQPETTNFTVNGRGYWVIPQLDTPYKDRFDAINNLQLRTKSGSLVSLSNLITITESVRPRVITHFQQMRFAEVNANLPNDYTVGEALKFIEGEAKRILPPHMKIDYQGQTRQFVEASGNMMKTFVLAMVFIFLILAAQFESFSAPLIVMFSVPLSILGALATLVFFHGTLNIYSQIGLITLIGLITKHGILLVEFANQLYKKGLSYYDAIVEAAQTRLRPILMTTLAMVFGALPLVLAGGASAASRQQLGLVITGGMVIGTIFTLFVIPAMYLLIKKDVSKPRA
jgi:multidrug efflux pump